jgi:hypothetical protein
MSNGQTIKSGSSNYTGARNTCPGGTSSFKNGTIKYGTSKFTNGQPYNGGQDKNVAFRVETKVNKPWKLSHSNRGF